MSVRNPKNQPIGKFRIKGATLLEVMVSVFIMGFGIMALMLAQMRSVSSVRDAELQTRVAQVTQNLAEGMLVTPNVRAAYGSAGALNYQAVRYSDYDQAMQDLSPLVSGDPLPNVVACPDGNTINRAQMVQCQINAFETDLRRALINVSSISYSITTANNQTTITVNWNESNGRNDSFDYTYSLNVGS